MLTSQRIGTADMTATRIVATSRLWKRVRSAVGVDGPKADSKRGPRCRSRRLGPPVGKGGQERRGPGPGQFSPDSPAKFGELTCLVDHHWDSVGTTAERMTELVPMGSREASAPELTHRVSKGLGVIAL